MFLIIKYQVKRENTRTSSLKKQDIFFCKPISTFRRILTLNICDEEKQIYQQKQKKISRKSTLRISEAEIKLKNIRTRTSVVL